MEQNKLETQFKEKLNSREIKPTELAWDRLDTMLSIAEVTKPKRKFSWLYIAASFIGLLLLSTVFLNQKENTIDIEKNTVAIEKMYPKVNSKSEIKSKTNETILSKTIVNQELKPFVQNQNNSNKKAENPTIITQENVVEEIKPNYSNILITEHKNLRSDNIDSLLASVEKNKKSELK